MLDRAVNARTLAADLETLLTKLVHWRADSAKPTGIGNAESRGRIAGKQFVLTRRDGNISAAQAAQQVRVGDSHARPPLLLVAKHELLLDALQVVAVRAVEHQQTRLARFALQADGALCVLWRSKRGFPAGGLGTHGGSPNEDGRLTFNGDADCCRLALVRQHHYATPDAYAHDSGGHVHVAPRTVVSTRQSQ